jgi:hypothetical protein
VHVAGIGLDEEEAGDDLARGIALLQIGRGRSRATGWCAMPMSIRCGAGSARVPCKLPTGLWI